MAVTADDIFKMAMAVADEVPSSGVFTASDLDEYKVRTPYILTMLESELLKEGEFYNTYGVTSADPPFSTAGPDDVWVEITLPSDFKQISTISFYNTQGYIVDVPYNLSGRNKLNVYAKFEGSLSVVYYAIPTPIAALTDTLHLDDVTARTLLPYGLAAELFKTEDDQIFNFASQRYQQLKREAMRRKATFIDTIDYYRW